MGRVGAAVAATPIRAAAVGLGAQVLFVPALVVVAVAMAITIIGLPFLAIVIPLALVAMLAPCCWASPASRRPWGVGGRPGRMARRVRGWAVGLGLVVLPTLVSRMVGVGLKAAGLPWSAGGGKVVEYLAWTVGLGAAILTGLGRWSTVPPPVPRPIHADVLRLAFLGGLSWGSRGASVRAVGGDAVMVGRVHRGRVSSRGGAKL